MTGLRYATSLQSGLLQTFLQTCSPAGICCVRGLPQREQKKSFCFGFGKACASACRAPALCMLRMCTHVPLATRGPDLRAGVSGGSQAVPCPSAVELSKSWLHWCCDGLVCCTSESGEPLHHCCSHALIAPAGLCPAHWSGPCRRDLKPCEIWSAAWSAARGQAQGKFRGLPVPVQGAWGLQQASGWPVLAPRGHN